MKFLSTTPGRLVIAAVCIAASQALIWREQSRMRLQAAQSARFDASALPMELGPWSGTLTELDPRMAAYVESVTMTNRLYMNDAGRQASVYVASWPAGELRVPHPPTICYPGGGWSILKNNTQH